MTKCYFYWVCLIVLYGVCLIVFGWRMKKKATKSASGNKRWTRAKIGIEGGKGTRGSPVNKKGIPKIRATIDSAIGLIIYDCPERTVSLGCALVFLCWRMYKSCYSQQRRDYRFCCRVRGFRCSTPLPRAVVNRGTLRCNLTFDFALSPITYRHGHFLTNPLSTNAQHENSFKREPKNIFSILFNI